MSLYRTLFTNLTGTDITYTNEASQSITPTAFDLDALPLNIESASCPVRVCLPMSEYGGNGEQAEVMDAGSTLGFLRFSWNVVDLYLHTPAGEGLGIYEFLPDLTRYAGAYVEKMGDVAGNLVTGMQLSSLNVIPSLIEYPIGSGQQFYGVECMSVWKELINA